MPAYRGIDIELHSQFDVETFPEYSPRPQSYYDERGITEIAPLFVDSQTSTCSVYVAVFPGSQFWISYAITQPPADDHYLLFKLFINGIPIVNWSCGKSDGWKGKTMFGLYERRDGDEGKKRVERRVLCFATPDEEDGERKDVTNAFDPDAHMEIRIFRAHGRKRIAREFEDYATTRHAKYGRGIEWVLCLADCAKAS
jgi:hypothetical protein